METKGQDLLARGDLYGFLSLAFLYPQTGALTDLVRGAEYVARLQQKTGQGVTVRDMVRGCRWLKDANEAEALLNELADRGWGEWRNQDPKRQGGRPTRRFYLSVSTKPPKDGGKPRFRQRRREGGSASPENGRDRIVI